MEIVVTPAKMKQKFEYARLDDGHFYFNLYKILIPHICFLYDKSLIIVGEQNQDELSILENYFSSEYRRTALHPSLYILIKWEEWEGYLFHALFIVLYI